MHKNVSYIVEKQRSSPECRAACDPLCGCLATRAPASDSCGKNAYTLGTHKPKHGCPCLTQPYTLGYKGSYRCPSRC